MDRSLIHRLINNTLTPSDREEILACYHCESSKDDFINLFNTIWKETENSDMPEDIRDEIYQRISEQIDVCETRNGANSSDITYTPFNDKSHDAPSQNKRRIPAKFIFQSAAACVIALLGVLSFHYYNDGQESRSLMASQKFEIRAERGQKADLTLPDGTHVWLNSQSMLSYYADYGMTDRDVRLAGEATFDVAKNKKLPFVVESKGVKTEALGTRFNIKAYPESDGFILSLYDGAVKVDYETISETLYPNQSIEIDLRSGKYKTLSNIEGNEAPWMKNELSFNGESLQEIAGEIRRIYNVEVCITDPELAQERFTGTINNTSLTNFLEILNITTPLKYYIENDTLYLSKGVRP